MKPGSAKGEILSKIRNALSKSLPQPYASPDNGHSFYKSSPEIPEIRFAENFKDNGGEFIFCMDEEEFLEQLNELAESKGWRHLFAWEKQLQDLFIKNNFKKCRIGRGLEKADAGVTGCEALIARTGSILLSSRQMEGRGLSIFPPAHVVVATVDQIVNDLEDGLKGLREKYPNMPPSLIALVSGPSQTADIEKTLVKGAHGPKEIYLFLIDKAAN